MALFESVFTATAHLHNCAHINLVEGREHGSGLLHLDQAFRDGLATPREQHALLALRRLHWHKQSRRGCGGWTWRYRRWGRCGRGKRGQRPRLALLQGSDDIGPRHAATRAVAAPPPAT